MGGSDSDATEGPGAGAWLGGVTADPGAMLAIRLDADENTRVLAKANPGGVGGTARTGTVMGACAGVYIMTMFQAHSHWQWHHVKYSQPFRLPDMITGQAIEQTRVDTIPSSKCSCLQAAASTQEGCYIVIPGVTLPQWAHLLLM